MPHTVRKVNYCYLNVPARAGQGAKLLGALRDAGVNLVAFSGFPAGGGRSQVDLVPENMAALKRVAKKQGWRLSVVKKGFLAQGTDEIGAIARQFERLAKAGVNVTAADAVAAGAGRYGMIFWVKPKDYARAAKALNAK
jgi:hypothetical protein